MPNPTLSDESWTPKIELGKSITSIVEEAIELGVKRPSSKTDSEEEVALSPSLNLNSSAEDPIFIGLKMEQVSMTLSWARIGLELALEPGRHEDSL
jgi:hypothetical protein